MENGNNIRSRMGHKDSNEDFKKASKEGFRHIEWFIIQAVGFDDFKYIRRYVFLELSFILFVKLFTII